MPTRLIVTKSGQSQQRSGRIRTALSISAWRNARSLPLIAAKRRPELPAASCSAAIASASTRWDAPEARLADIAREIAMGAGSGPGPGNGPGKGPGKTPGKRSGGGSGSGIGWTRMSRNRSSTSLGSFGMMIQIGSTS